MMNLISKEAHDLAHTHNAHYALNSQVSPTVSAQDREECTGHTWLQVLGVESSIQGNGTAP